MPEINQSAANTRVITASRITVVYSDCYKVNIKTMTENEYRLHCLRNLYLFYLIIGLPR